MSNVYEPNDSGQDIAEEGSILHTKPVAYVKALLAAGIAFAGGMATSLADEGMTTGEMWTVIAATLMALGVVYQVPNARR